MSSTETGGEAQKTQTSTGAEPEVTPADLLEIPVRLVRDRASLREQSRADLRREREHVTPEVTINLVLPGMTAVPGNLPHVVVPMVPEDVAAGRQTGAHVVLDRSALLAAVESAERSPEAGAVATATQTPPPAAGGSGAGGSGKARDLWSAPSEDFATGEPDQLAHALFGQWAESASRTPVPGWPLPADLAAEVAAGTTGATSEGWFGPDDVTPAPVIPEEPVRSDWSPLPKRASRALPEVDDEEEGPARSTPGARVSPRPLRGALDDDFLDDELDAPELPAARSGDIDRPRRRPSERDGERLDERGRRRPRDVYDEDDEPAGARPVSRRPSYRDEELPARSLRDDEVRPARGFIEDDDEDDDRDWRTSASGRGPSRGRDWDRDSRAPRSGFVDDLDDDDVVDDWREDDDDDEFSAREAAGRTIRPTPRRSVAPVPVPVPGMRDSDEDDRDFRSWADGGESGPITPLPQDRYLDDEDDDWDDDLDREPAAQYDVYDHEDEDDDEDDDEDERHLARHDRDEDDEDDEDEDDDEHESGQRVGISGRAVAIALALLVVVGLFAQQIATPQDPKGPVSESNPPTVAAPAAPGTGPGGSSPAGGAAGGVPAGNVQGSTTPGGAVGGYPVGMPGTTTPGGVVPAQQAAVPANGGVVAQPAGVQGGDGQPANPQQAVLPGNIIINGMTPSQLCPQQTTNAMQNGSMVNIASSHC